MHSCMNITVLHVSTYQTTYCIAHFLLKQEELKEQHRDEIQHLTDTLGEEAKRKLEETQAELKLEHRQEIEEITADHETEIDVSWVQ